MLSFRLADPIPDVDVRRRGRVVSAQFDPLSQAVRSEVESVSAVGLTCGNRRWLLTNYDSPVVAGQECNSTIGAHHRAQPFDAFGDETMVGTTRCPLTTGSTVLSTTICDKLSCGLGP